MTRETVGSVSEKSKREHQPATKEMGWKLGTVAYPHHSHTWEAEVGSLESFFKRQERTSRKYLTITCY